MAEKELIGGWWHQDENLKVLHTTSDPCISLEKALSYADHVKSFYGIQPYYISRREPHDGRYRLIPYKFDPRKGKFVPIEEALE